MDSRISVIIIEYNRQKHLSNVITGIFNSTLIPDEIIIVSYSNSINFDKTKYRSKIRVKLIKLPDDSALPAAKARNIGAKMASNEKLIFLDVDCIPSTKFFQKMSEQLSNHSNAMIMGSPKYLKKQVSNNLDDQTLEKRSVFHPRRPLVQNLKKEDRYELFWSLCFAITKIVLLKLDYFDESYSGYGGEDTDLAFKAKELNIPFYLSEAVVFHQHHPFYRPPVHQLENIVSNCNHFYRKWNIWAMDKHLRAFSEEQFIEWEVQQSFPIEIIRKPSKQVQDLFLINNEPFA